MKENQNRLGFKKIALRLTLTSISSLVFLEIMLQIIPLKITEYPARIQYITDKDVGYIPKPLQNENYHLSCVKNTHITTNNIGIRETRNSNSKKPKIALIGDSFLHGLAVPDRLHIATLLSSYTGSEIWNGGVSGYGTYQELLWWRKLAKPEKPAITILFLFLENDIRDNQCKLCRAEGQVYSPCCEVKNGVVKEIKKFQIRNTSFLGWKDFFKKNCRTYNLLLNTFSGSKLPREAVNFFQTESFAYNVYRPGHSESWEQGWQILEWTLLQLKQECEEAGSRLLVVNVPGPVQWARDWRKELSRQLQSDFVPSDLDIHYAQNRLKSILEGNKINWFDLVPGFISYRDKNQLPEPVFGFCCDGHWNPIGHQLAADLVYNYLIEVGWLKGDLRLPEAPRNLIGDKLYEDIYNCHQITF